MFKITLKNYIWRENWSSNQSVDIIFRLNILKTYAFEFSVFSLMHLGNHKPCLM